MAKRRTTASAPDVLNRSIRPGDAVAVAVSTAYAAAASSQTLIEVEAVYLDDSKGRPYQRGIFYRNPADGSLRRIPSDDTTDDPSRNPVITLDPRWTLVPYMPKTAINDIGRYYAGPDEILAIQEHRLVGRPLGIDGQPVPDARRSTYEIDRAVRVFTSEQLAAPRQGALADR